jgi:hypothetical protein
MKVSSAWTPGIGLPRSVGNHFSVETCCISDCPMPTANPAAQAIEGELNPANSAAASAGTTNNTSVIESAWASGAATIPIAPAKADASTVLASESWPGERPTSMPKTSFSDAARVAKPSRVNRNKAASASAITTTIPAIQNRLAGIDLPNTSTMSFVKMLGIGCDADPNQSNIVAWSTSRIPSEATNLASGDDVRNGRKTSNSLRMPSSTDTRIVTTTAGTVPSVTPK